MICYLGDLVSQSVHVNFRDDQYNLITNCFGITVMRYFG